MYYAVSPETVAKIKSEYVLGLGSIREISEKYGATYKPIEVRSAKEGWREERESYLKRVVDIRLQKAQERSEQWVERVISRSEKNWSTIDASEDGMVTSGSGIDSSEMLGYARARAIYNDMARKSLGLTDPVKQVDVTTGGQSLGESFVSAIAKLRESDQPKLTEKDLERVLEAEIIDDKRA